METKISRLMDHYTDEEFTPAGDAGVDPEAVREKVLARLDPKGQAVKAEKKPAKRKIFTLARVAAIAAVAALCVASMAVGALAFPTERIVEKPVKVPVEPEAIDMDDIGISLILPDEWKGKYTVIHNEETGAYIVYVTSLYEYCMAHEDWHDEEVGPYMGILFSVSWAADGDNSWHMIPSYELAHTGGGSYVMALPSDVQNPYILDPDTLELEVTPDDPLFIQRMENEFPGLSFEEIAAMDRDYFTLARSIGDIRLVLNGAMARALGSIPIT